MNDDDGSSVLTAPPAVPRTHHVPPGVPYHRVLAGEKRRVGRGVLAIVLLVGGLFAFSAALGYLASWIDSLFGRSGFTPLVHGSALFAIALLIPWSMLIQRWLYGVRGASLHSVRSQFRIAVFGRAFLAILPIWAVYITVLTALTPFTPGSWSLADLLGMFVVTVLLTPLQSAAEEYGLRGLGFRVAGSWGRGPRTALIIGVVVSSLVFMVIHAATDPWLNLYYFTFGVTLAVITWRTGGLETGVVIHAINNTLTFLLVLVVHADLLAGFDRSVGAGSAIMLLPCALLIATAAVVWVRTRRTGPALTPVDAPAAG